MIPNNNAKKQVVRNTVALQKVSDRFNPVFARISDTATRIDLSPIAYMVTGPHLTKYGFYYCLPLRIDSDTVNAGYSTAGVKMKNNNLTIGPLNAGVDTFPAAWSGTTSYSENDLVSSGRQVFKALRDNLNQNPLTEAEDWNEITVEVLNLSEWMGWDGAVGAEPPDNKKGDAAIAELLPKLCYLDTVTASSQLGSGGGRVIAGFDNIGITRLFTIEKESAQTNTQQFTAWAIKADGIITGSGEGLNSVKVIPFTDTNVEFFSSSINQWWVDHTSTTTRNVSCIWIKGMWYWIPEIQKNIGSGQDVFKEINGLYCGRTIGTGLQTGGTGGRTDIEAIP